MKQKQFSALFLLLFLFCASSALTSCSSAPKRAMENTSVKIRISSFLDIGKGAMQQGNFSAAETNFNRAYQLALSVDSVSQLCYISLSRASLEMAKGGENRLQLAEEFLSQAKHFASLTDSPNLRAVCALYEAQMLLEQNDVQQAAVLLSKSREFLTKEPYYLAFSKRLEGSVYKMQGDYAEAEKNYLEAEKLYVKNRYVNELGLTWYQIAQVRSLAGKKSEAVAAITSAVKYDRAAENTYALGMDYFALGLILLKNGPAQNSPSDEEKRQASQAFTHAAQIFAAGKYTDLAQKAEQRAQSATSGL